MQSDQAVPNFGVPNGNLGSGSPNFVQNGGYQPTQVQTMQYPLPQYRSNPVPISPAPYTSDSLQYAQLVPMYANSGKSIQPSPPQAQDERPALAHAYQEVITNQLKGQPFVSATVR